MTKEPTILTVIGYAFLGLFALVLAGWCWFGRGLWRVGMKVLGLGAII